MGGGIGGGIVGGALDDCPPPRCRRRLAKLVEASELVKSLNLGVGVNGDVRVTCRVNVKQ